MEQGCVGEGRLRVLVEHPHPGVGRRIVEVEVALLDILAVVALVAGEAEEALLEDGVAPVPEREREAEALLIVADTGQAVFVPTVGPRAGVVVGEILPGASTGAVVLAHGAPGPLGQVGAPALPGCAVGLQTRVLFSD